MCIDDFYDCTLQNATSVTGFHNCVSDLWFHDKLSELPCC